MRSAFILMATVALTVQVQAASVDVPINLTTEKGIGESVGNVTITETEHGLLFTPNLKNIKPTGLHGFHLHEKPSCDALEKDGKMTAALAAGGHFDPEETGKHLGPYDNNGHLGDIPPLYVAEDGTATYPILAPRIKKLEQIKNTALMVHLGSDNNSDEPLPLGGGGARFACGVIK